MNKEFDKPLPQNNLDLNEKFRSNIFPWRGQFSPELIENIFKAYCFENSKVLDPFCGSGTVLFEAALNKLEAIGVELNPAAHFLSKTYELINTDPEKLKEIIDEIFEKIQFSLNLNSILENQELLSLDYFSGKIQDLIKESNKEEKIILNAFVILCDIKEEKIAKSKILNSLFKIQNSIKKLPYSNKKITSLLGDSRNIPIKDESIDFVITSPPYINVFNYHQNYRGSAESLGWDLLKIAKSEIGSNRANRGNRFLTVIQYCIDISNNLFELHRVVKNSGRMIFVVGNESNVLSVPFYNANIICKLAEGTKTFKTILRQERSFKNKFGKLIKEELIHLEKNQLYKPSPDEVLNVAREVAREALSQGMNSVDGKNKDLLIKSIAMISKTQGIPKFPL